MMAVRSVLSSVPTPHHRNTRYDRQYPERYPELCSDTPPSEHSIRSLASGWRCPHLFRHPTIGTLDTISNVKRSTQTSVPTPHHRNTRYDLITWVRISPACSDTPPSEHSIRSRGRAHLAVRAFRHPTIGTLDTITTDPMTTLDLVPTPHHRNTRYDRAVLLAHEKHRYDTPPSEHSIRSKSRAPTACPLFRHPTIGTLDTIRSPPSL